MKTINRPEKTGKQEMIKGLRVLTVFVALTALFLTTSAYAERAADYVAKGDTYYQNRAQGHQGDWAVTGPIEKAIESYLKAYEMGDDSPELVAKLMQATYFYATYAEKDEKKQKAALQRAVDIGEKALKKNPDHAVLNYQMGGCWGRWGEVNGIFASAKEGVADRVREHARKVVKANAEYAHAGGYRTLGRLHFLAPRIPFILSWPRHEKSVEFLEKAVAAGPANLTNHLFYAESLIKSDRYDEALRELNIVIDAEVNEAKVVEVLRDKKAAKELMEKYSKKLVAKK